MGTARVRAAAVVLLAIASAALEPATGAAVDSDLKHSYVLKLDASNGYKIIAFAASERAGGRGELGLIVASRDSGVVYRAPATVTATRIEANLGRLGKVSLDVIPSGRKREMPLRCVDEGPDSMEIEPQLFRGVFEFHGEEGFADATSVAPREYARFFTSLLCLGFGTGETSGAMLPGARLRLHARRGSFRANLQANKNRPGARTRIEVETHENRQGISISRFRTVRAGASAFDYDPLLRTATLVPPAPFAGRAGFHRGAAPANRWSGNLTVDMPGRSDVPLAGAGIGATLVHACLQEGSGHAACRPVPPA